MARALGAAFLTHQVEELEHRVSGMHVRRNSNGSGGRGGRGGGRGGRGGRGGGVGGMGNGGWRSESPPRSHHGYRGRGRGGAAGGAGGDSGGGRVASPIAINNNNRSPNGRVNSAANSPRKPATPRRPTARTIVVDASVLVHALGQVIAWCREDRHEEIVIPLEGTLHHTPSSELNRIEFNTTHLFGSLEHPRSLEKGHVPTCSTRPCCIAHSRRTSRR